MDDVRITAIVGSYESAEKMSDGIFENIVLEGVCYKPFAHNDELYIPTVAYEPIYDYGKCIAMERHLYYQKISKELIKEVIECN